MMIHWYFKVCAIAWMITCVLVYFVVTVPVESPIAAALPDFVWQLRAAVLPFFYSEPTAL